MPHQPALPTPEIITVYGADWCADCGRAKRYLETMGIPFRYVDLELDPVARQLVDNAGIRAIPVIVTPSGQVLVDPGLDVLATTVGSAA